MADANKTLITRAELSSANNTTTGRRAITLDGATSDAGSFTGIRDLTGLLMPGKVTAGRLLVARSGQDVWWIFNELKLTEPFSPDPQLLDVVAALAGFRPPYMCTHDYQASTSSGSMRISLSPSGRMYVQYAGAPVINTMMHTFTQAAWPSTLPGVADGEPVIV